MLFENIDKDGIESVNYDIPELPIYIRDGTLALLKNYTFQAHYHSDWEFIAVLEGQMQFSINGKVVMLDERDSLFVNSNAVHFGFSSEQRDCKYICLIVHPSLFCTNPYIERNYITPVCSSGYAYFVFKEPAMNSLISKIHDKKQRGKRHLYFDIQGDLFQLAKSVYERIDRLPKTSESCHAFVEIRKMLDFIAANYDRKTALSDIAESANVCKNSCIVLFKKFTGLTPMQYVTRYRIEQSCILLRETDKPLAEVALDCGFSSSSYFSEIFKQSLRLTPREYRNRWKQSP